MFECIFREKSRLKPTDIAYCDDVSAISYRQMADDVARCAGWLQTCNIKKGEHVVLHVANVYLHWVLFFALETRGAVSTAVGTASPLTRAQLASLQADFYFTDRSPDADLETRGVVCSRGTLLRIRKFRALPSPPLRRSGDDPICVVLSSGTTGSPKRVLLSRTMIDTRAIIERSSSLISGQSRVLVTLPNSSIGGFLTILTTWAVGGTVCMRPSSLSAESALTKLRPTMIAGAPSHFAELLGALPVGFACDPPVDASVGGGMLPAAVATAIRQKLRGQIALTYGSTEMGYIARGDYDLIKQYEGAAGFVLPFVEVSIRNDRGSPVPYGEVGEIWVRGRHVVDGYLGHPDQSKLSFRDGWYHPGDIGVMRADGLLAIRGRTDDLMNFRGRKMLPAAIEAKILGLGLVADVAMFMARRYGSDEPLPWIACVARDKLVPAALAPAIPRDIACIVVIVDAIPRNAMGKIDRRVLRDRAEAGELQVHFA